MPQRTVEEIRERLRTQPLVRSFVIERDAAIDEETRTVSLAFASDRAVEHWFGYLELSMKGKAMRTERLESGAPLLMDHDSRDVVGVIESHSISDGIARAIVRFSDSARATEIFNDVRSGIRRNVSVGFMVHSMELTNEKETRKGAIPQYRSDDWEPYEVSIVSIPADISVGVGRELDTVSQNSQSREITTTTEKTMPEPIENTPVTPAVETPVRAAAPSADAEYVARTKEIVAFAEIFGQGDLARNMIAASRDVTLDDVRAAIQAKQTPSTVVPPAPVETRQPVQLARTVSRVQLKAFKGEGAQERAYRVGMHMAAMLLRDETAIRYCRENGISLTRVQTEGDNTKGGYTVLPEFEQTIFDLRLQYGVARRVCDVVPMSSDQKIVTRRTGGLTAYAVGPSTRGTYSNITDDQFELIARKWMVLSKREDELTEDSFISWADRTAEEGAYAFTYAEDNALFNGDGTSTYHGIVGLTNKILNLSATRANIASAVVASGNAWSEIVIGDLLNVVGRLPSFARKSGNVRWYCTSEFWASVLQRLALAAGGVTHAEFEGELKESFLGKPVEIVEVMQHVEANDTIPLLYGNLAQAATFGDRRGVTMKMTDSNDTDFESDLEATKLTERFDINVHDVGNQSSTAADRRAGPVVALLTAAS